MDLVTWSTIMSIQTLVFCPFKGSNQQHESNMLIKVSPHQNSENYIRSGLINLDKQQYTCLKINSQQSMKIYSFLQLKQQYTSLKINSQQSM